MPQKNLVKLQCSVCKHINYYTRRNRKTVQKKLELKKFCKWCRKHTLHREMKK